VIIRSGSVGVFLQNIRALKLSLFSSTGCEVTTGHNVTVWWSRHWPWGERRSCRYTLYIVMACH